VQLAGLHDVTDLMKLPYRIIGQLPVLNHIASNTDSPDPLVMVFAGPPGHGKTELAKRVGDLLRVETTTIVCSQMKSDTGLMGSKQGYHRSQEDSKLNNHLSQCTSSCSVVFLDEFDIARCMRRAVDCHVRKSVRFTTPTK
jgi:tRNA uridine 5-carbamoylmethylation protein Kti12